MIALGTNQFSWQSLHQDKLVEVLNLPNTQEHLNECIVLANWLLSSLNLYMVVSNVDNTKLNANKEQKPFINTFMLEFKRMIK